MSALDGKTARLVRLFAAMVAFDSDALRRIRREAPAGEPDRAWREVVLMAHLFCGFPRTLSALAVLQGEGGLGAASPDAESAEMESDVDPARGVAFFERIYGDGTDAVRGSLRDYHPELEAWVLEHAYARVLARPGLDAAARELCAVAALAIQGHDRQLASHVRGAVRCGATADQVRAVIDLCEEWIDGEHLERARSVVERFVR